LFFQINQLQIYHIIFLLFLGGDMCSSNPSTHLIDQQLPNESDAIVNLKRRIPYDGFLTISFISPFSFTSSSFSHFLLAYFVVFFSSFCLDEVLKPSHVGRFFTIELKRFRNCKILNCQSNTLINTYCDHDDFSSASINHPPTSHVNIIPRNSSSNQQLSSIVNEDLFSSSQNRRTNNQISSLIQSQTKPSRVVIFGEKGGIALGFNIEWNEI